MDDKVLKVMAAKIDAMQFDLVQIITLCHRIEQEQKRILSVVSMGKEPFDSAPKGERNTVVCERCGCRMFRDESMKQTQIINDDIVLFTVCRKCFYGTRKLTK